MAGLSRAQNALSKLLQPSERLILALEVQEAPSSSSAEQNGVGPVVRGASRMLGIVVNDSSGKEEAAIIVCRRPTSPLIVSRLPIYADFTVSISQTESASTSSSMEAKSRFAIEFKSASAPRGVTVLADDMKMMSDLLTEVRRLAKVAQSEGWHALGPTHAWLAAYKEHDVNLDDDTLARFDTISSSYSVRSAARPGLQRGFSSRNWEDGEEENLEALREREAAEQRAQWIVEQMQRRETEFTRTEDIKVFCTTFNVNDSLPKEADLSSWLADTGDAELLVFGFQEFDLSTEAMVRYTTHREDAWRLAIERGLGERASEYEKLHSRQLVGALIIIYVRKSAAQHISHVSSASLATGIMGLMANKGATGIRLKYKDTWLIFVNSHLAAFTNQVEQRNQMVRDTVQYLGFPKVKDPWLPNLRVDAARPQSNAGVYDSHHLIWMGDLNYRVDLQREEVLKMVESSDFDLLLQFDQLRIQRKHGLAFADFEEADITFPPTFKFDPRSDKYDTSDKMRCPSWTDRILWLSLHPGTIKPLNYRGHFDVKLSDHRPVSATLQVQVATVVSERRAEVLREVTAELDSFDNDTQPDVKLSPSPSVEFGTISYLRPDTKTIEVINVGCVIAQWSFVLKPGTRTLTPPWLTVSPVCGLILPGDKASISITIHVDDETAPGLNFAATPADELSDLLILSLEAKDLFLSVTARDYERTCFANSLERLYELGEDPIRRCPSEKMRLINSGSYLIPVTEEDKAKAPSTAVVRPLQRMLDFLVAYGLPFPDLFVGPPGDPALVTEIREALDTGDDFPYEMLLGPRPVAPDSPEAAMALLRRLELEHGEGGGDLSSGGGADLGAMALSANGTDSPRPTPRPDAASPVSRGVAAMCTCVLRWLEGLPEPVVPFSLSLYTRVLRTEPSREEAYAVVHGLPKVHADTLLYLIAFLRVVAAQHAKGRPEELAARLSRLAVVFSGVLVRGGPSTVSDPSILPSTMPRRKKQFLLRLLEDDTSATTATKEHGKPKPQDADGRKDAENGQRAA